MTLPVPERVAITSRLGVTSNPDHSGGIMANRLTRQQRRAGITYRVGAPPPSPPKPRQQRPVSIWPVAMLGTLVLVACIALWFGANRTANHSPAGTATITVETTP